MYTVKEVSALLGVSQHTIRFYTDKGLIPSVKRDKNNNRLFDEESLNWMTAIKCLKECGMSLDAIKNYVDLCLDGDSTVLARYEIIQAQKVTAQEQLKEAQRRIDYLNHKLEHYQEIIKHHAPDDMNPRKWNVSDPVKVS